MGPPKKPKQKQPMTARDEVKFSTVVITVMRTTGGANSPEPGVTVQGVPTGTVFEGQPVLTTNDRGQFESKAFRSGEVTIRLTKEGFGPFPAAPGRGVVEGPISVTTTFLPNNETTPPPGSTKLGNRLEVVIARRAPRLTVVVTDATGMGEASGTRIAAAAVEVIGIEKGLTDAQGKFSVDGIPFGKHGVRVSKQNFSSATNEGDYFIEIEVREQGILPDRPFLGNRDMQLEVGLVHGELRPIPLPFNQTNRVAVWVSGGATPHTVADDPRLPGNPTTDTPQGQAGWDVGIREPYGTTVPGETPAFKRLATFLQPGMSLPDHVGGGVLQEHQIKRLAIVAHGLPGIMDADQFEAGFGLGGARPQASRSLTISRFSEYEDSLSKLRTVLARDAHVYFECCNLAANEEGERLLTKISSLWPTVFVVGSKSMIVVPAGLGRRGGQDFPGLRDSNHNEVPVPPVPKDYEELAFARDLTKLPWLSETSIHATVARNGSIIRRGTPVAAGR